MPLSFCSAIFPANTHCYHSSRIASIGFTDKARQAGANPAKTPSKAMNVTVSTASENDIWNDTPCSPCETTSFSMARNNQVAATIPDRPAPIVRTILYYHAKRYPYCLEDLINAGADPYDVDENGNTVLHIMIANGRYDITMEDFKDAAKFLPGDIIYKKNNDGKTPVDLFTELLTRKDEAE